MHIGLFNVVSDASKPYGFSDEFAIDQSANLLKLAFTDSCVTERMRRTKLAGTDLGEGDQDDVMMVKLGIIMQAYSIMIASGSGSASAQQEKVVFFSELIMKHIHKLDKVKQNHKDDIKMLKKLQIVARINSE